eukprot:NP_001040692.2 Uncharacterized protein CELE_T28B8.3 [Caenorhabditis elegans]
MTKNYVRPTKQSIFLPYFEELEAEADKKFDNIINGMMAGFLTDNLIETGRFTKMFQFHIQQFGLRMSKEMLLNLVRFFYEVLIKEHQHTDLIMVACEAFKNMMDLVKPRRFGWRDHTLDWRPLRQLHYQVFLKKMTPDLEDDCKHPLFYFARFYDPSEHQAIWETILQEIPIGNQDQTELLIDICWRFLSVYGMTEEDMKHNAVNTWIKELWEMYLKAEMNTSWTAHCLDHIVEICTIAPGAFDLSSYYDVLFTKMIRGFDLTVREGKLEIGNGEEKISSFYLADICAYTIGGPNSSLSHFQRLIQYISFHVHPPNIGEHTDQISMFLEQFMESFKERLNKERLNWEKRKCSKDYYLKDSDIDAVVESISDLAIMLMFNEDIDYKLIKLLTTVNREYVAPKLLNHLYSSLTAVSEPHRLTTLIEAFTFFVYEIIRTPDAEYRTPRNIVYDSKWLIYMEEERKSWPTFHLGSEVPMVKTHKFASLRAHAFYILEIFVNQINVNDVDRTKFVLKTLEILFSSFPLMDFSAAIKFHEEKMSNDDRLICLLSKRVPSLVEHTLEKLLEVITCLSVEAPNTSDSTGGVSLSLEYQKHGEDETIFKNGFSRLISVIFDRVNDTMRKRLFDRLFDYISTSEFTNYLATDILSSLIFNAVRTSGDAFRHYAEFILKKLKLLITEILGNGLILNFADEVRTSKTPPVSVLFYCALSGPCFAANRTIVLDNEHIFFEIIEIFLNCANKTIFKCGTIGVSTLLHNLLNITTNFPVKTEHNQFSEPFSEWNPIEFWAKCVHYKDTVVHWSIPAKADISCVERIANKFFFPYIQKLMTEVQDRDSFRRITEHLHYVVFNLPTLKYPTNVQWLRNSSTPFCLPIASSSLGASCVLEYELKGPNGENVCEMVVSMIEHVITKTQDPTSLINICSIAKTCLRVFEKPKDDITSLLDPTSALLVDSIYLNIVKASQHTIDHIAFIKHIQTQLYHRCEIRDATDFDERILKCLLELSVNDYFTVQKRASGYLKTISQNIRCRHLLIPRVVEILTDAKLVNKNRLAGAMDLTLKLKWIKLVTPRIRLIIWDAVLRIKVMDNVEIRGRFEAIRKELKNFWREPIYRLATRETHDERNKKVAVVALLLIKPSSDWTPFLTEEALKIQTDTWFDYEKLSHTLRLKLVDNLFKNHIQNKNHHHTRGKLARSMIYAAQMEACDSKTIRLLLEQLFDEHYTSRNEARETLAHWLKENKQKTVREKIKPPKRVDHGVKLERGIREDNLWLVYDSENLPNTEQKWNEIVFVEKEKGACRWPESISVVRKRSHGQPLEPKNPSESDKMIIGRFSQSKFISKLFNFRLIEKEDYENPNDKFYRILKYVIRNYPDTKIPLKLMSEHLKLLMKSKKKNEQLLAAEIFIGIVLGIKHRSFFELDEFWNDINTCLNQFLDILTIEAEEAWSIAMETILDPTSDLRRVWWLIEGMIDGARMATLANEFQLAFRITSIQSNCWRYGQISKRASDIAWTKLQLALTDSLRNAISEVFYSCSEAREASSNATLINIPSRFIPDSLDTIIHKIIDKIPDLKFMEDQKIIRASLSHLDLNPPTGKMSRRRSSAIDLEDIKVSGMDTIYTRMHNNFQSMTYFRVLLQTITQHYGSSTKSWSPILVKLLPKLMEYANEDDYDLSEETYRDVDITQNSALIIHDYMSVSWISHMFLDEILKALGTTFHSNSWHVRLAVIKFVQAAVYSNIFPMSQQSRRDDIEKLLFRAVYDREISVRKEAAKCLLLFIHCSYIQFSDQKIDKLANILQSETELEARAHGASLALGAFVLAFPFFLPTNIIKPLSLLSSSSSNQAVVKKTMTETVREFRRQHRDDWEETKKILGDALTFDIENTTAPAYYA